MLNYTWNSSLEHATFWTGTTFMNTIVEKSLSDSRCWGRYLYSYVWDPVTTKSHRTWTHKSVSTNSQTPLLVPCRVSRRWRREWRRATAWMLRKTAPLLFTPWWGLAGSVSHAGDPPSANWERDWSRRSVNSPQALRRSTRRGTATDPGDPHPNGEHRPAHFAWTP